MLYGAGNVVGYGFVGDPRWADAHGFSGSQHDGWTGLVPLNEITDIRETVSDLP